jgi:hypothetical protein
MLMAASLLIPLALTTSADLNTPQSYQSVRAFVTGYNTVPGQTDDTPCIAASGANICGRHDAVACPRHIGLGTVVEIRGTTYVCEDRTARKFNSRFDISCDKDTSCPYEVAGWAIVKLYQRVATEIIHPAVEIVRPAVRQADMTRIHHSLDGAPPRGRLAAAVREDRPEADGRQHAVTILRRIASTVFPQRHKPTSDDLGRFRRA